MPNKGRKENGYSEHVSERGHAEHSASFCTGRAYAAQHMDVRELRAATVFRPE